MARQEIIELNIKTDKAISQVENLQSEIKDLKNEVTTSTDKAAKGFEDMNKASKSLAVGIKSVGLALKAAGIGLAIAAFNGLKEVIGSSQEVTDFFNTGVEAMKIGFAKFADKFEDDSGSMFSTWGTFVNSISNGVKAFKKNFTDQMTGQFEMVTGYIKKSFLEMRIAFNNFVGDTEEAEALTKDLEAATKQMSDGYTKMKGAATEVVTVLGDLADKTKKALKDTLDQAQANVELAKQAQIAAVQQQGLIEKYDIQAEQLRQIRDNEFKTINERIQANNDLKDVLDLQEKEMLKMVNTQIEQAQRQYDLNQNQENYIALLEAQNEKQAVLAQIEGFRSEQDSNANALLREKIELQQSVLDGIDERKVAEAEFTASLEDDVMKRLQLERDAIDIEEQLGVERLTRQRDQFKEGTQAYVDANEELLNFQQEIHFKRLENEKALADEIIAENERVGDAMVDIFKKAEEQIKKDKDAVEAQKLQVTQNTLNAMQQLVNAFEASNEKNAKKAFQLNKALAIATVLIDTSRAIMKAAAETTDISPVQALRIANMVAMGVAGAAQVAAIASQKFQPSGSGGGGTTPSVSTGAPTQATAPQFNIVGQSDFNQIASALGQQQPVQAFVVAQDVTTAQQLNNNIISAATVGG